MSRSFVPRLAAAAALAGLLLLPGSAAATITGGCTGTGTATSGGVDLTTAAEWHVKKADVGGGSGQSPTPVKAASVGAAALGLVMPIANGTSEDGETEGSVSGVSASFLATLGAQFTVSGSADNGCAGQIRIIIDDVNPLLTVLGGGGLVLALLGLLVVLASMRGSSGLGRRLISGIFGLLGGIGAALAGEQFGLLDPTQPIGLGIAIVAAVLGLLTTGLLRRPGEVEPPAAPTPPRPTTPVGTETESYPGGAVGGGSAG